MTAKTPEEYEGNIFAWLAFSQYCPFCHARGYLERYRDDRTIIWCTNCGRDWDADKGPPAEPRFGVLHRR